MSGRWRLHVLLTRHVRCFVHNLLNRRRFVLPILVVRLLVCIRHSHCDGSKHTRRVQPFSPILPTPARSSELTVSIMTLAPQIVRDAGALVAFERGNNVAPAAMLSAKHTRPCQSLARPLHAPKHDCEHACVRSSESASLMQINEKCTSACRIRYTGAHSLTILLR